MSEAERKAWEDGFRQGQLDGRRWAAEWIEAERAKGSDPDEYETAEDIAPDVIYDEDGVVVWERS